MSSLRFAFRQLRRRPTYAAAVVVSLALGLGANAALFALLDALLFRPIGATEPQRLVRVAAVGESGHDRGLTPAMVDAMRRSQVFDGVCAVLTPVSAIEAAGVTAPRSAHAVSGDCFATLGIQPAQGRLLAPADDRPGAEPVAVLTHQMWIRDFGGREPVVGERIVVDGRPTTIVGVSPGGFTGVLLGFQPDVIYPLARLEERAQASRPGATVPAQVLARLRAGDDARLAATRLLGVWRTVLDASAPIGTSPEARAEHRRLRPQIASAEAGLDFSLRGRFTRPLLVLMGLSGVVLAIACLNSANLLLARGRDRSAETALRLALGAPRWRVVRDELVEILVLLLLGVGAGGLTAYGGVRMVVAILSVAYPGLQLDVTPDLRVVLATCGVATLILLAFGGIPAWRIGAVDPGEVLGAGTRTTPRRGGAASTFVASQVALAVVLVTGGILCARSIAGLRHARPGFDTDRIMSAQMIPRQTAGEARRPDHSYYGELMARVGGLPGVSAVAMSSRAPLLGAPQVTLAASEARPGSQRRTDVLAVTERFTEVMQLPLVVGRAIDATDTAAAPGVAMISETLALDLFGTRSATGRRIRIGQGTTSRSLGVVGVVGDAVVGPLRDQNVRLAYTSFWQTRPGGSPTLLARTDRDARSATSMVAREIERLGREYPARIRSLTAERDASIGQEYLLAAMATAFAALGLVLAAVGVYGIVSAAVARRSHEIGVRLALGAAPADIARSLLGWTLRLLGAGIAVGLPLAWMGARSIGAVLPTQRESEIAPVATAAGVLVAVGLTAAWRPVRRAMRIRPCDWLRVS